jgi:uncharacterized membrane protein
MIPLTFEDSPEPLLEKKKNVKMLSAFHLQIGNVIARIGMPFLPGILQSMIGLIHFGIVSQEVVPLLSSKERTKSQIIAESVFENRTWFDSFYLKRNCLQRFMIQHYDYAKGKIGQIKETTLGEFLFGEEHWSNDDWRHMRIPACWTLIVPNQGIEHLQRRLTRLQETLGERKYSLLFRNCENFVNYIAFDKDWSQAQSAQTIAVLVIIGLIVIALIAIIVWLCVRKNRRRQNRRPPSMKVAKD